MSVLVEFAEQAELLSIEISGAQARFILDRPETDNALNSALLQELLTAFDLVEMDPSIRVIILEGAGDFAFSSGLDLGEVSSMVAHEAEELARKVAEIQEAMHRLNKPVIAALKGTCIGAGLELAAFADFRITRDDARLGLCTVSVGLVPGGASLAKLSALIGEGNTRALSLTGGLVSAERGFVMGLVTSVVEAAAFEDSIQQLADHLAKLPAQTVAELLALHASVWSTSFGAASKAGEESLGRCIGQSETTERLRALVGAPEPAATVH